MSAADDLKRVLAERLARETSHADACTSEARDRDGEWQRCTEPGDHLGDHENDYVGSWAWDAAVDDPPQVRTYSVVLAGRLDELIADLDAVVAEQVAAGQEQVLLEAAVRVERHRRRNPMNGDGFNSAIDTVLRLLDSLTEGAASGAAEWERARLDDEDDIRVCAQNGWDPPARTRVDRLRERDAAAAVEEPTVTSLAEGRNE